MYKLVEYTTTSVADLLGLGGTAYTAEGMAFSTSSASPGFTFSSESSSYSYQAEGIGIKTASFFSSESRSDSWTFPSANSRGSFTTSSSSRASSSQSNSYSRILSRSGNTWFEASTSAAGTSSQSSSSSESAAYLSITVTEYTTTASTSVVRVLRSSGTTTTVGSVPTLISYLSGASTLSRTATTTRQESATRATVTTTSGTGLSLVSTEKILETRYLYRDDRNSMVTRATYYADTANGEYFVVNSVSAPQAAPQCATATSVVEWFPLEPTANFNTTYSGGWVDFTAFGMTYVDASATSDVAVTVTTTRPLQIGDGPYTSGGFSTATQGPRGISSRLPWSTAADGLRGTSISSSLGVIPTVSTVVATAVVGTTSSSELYTVLGGSTLYGTTVNSLTQSYAELAQKWYRNENFLGVMNRFGTMPFYAPALPDGPLAGSPAGASLSGAPGLYLSGAAAIPLRNFPQVSQRPGVIVPMLFESTTTRIWPVETVTRNLSFQQGPSVVTWSFSTTQEATSNAAVATDMTISRPDYGATYLSTWSYTIDASVSSTSLSSSMILSAQEPYTLSLVARVDGFGEPPPTGTYQLLWPHPIAILGGDHYPPGTYTRLALPGLHSYRYYSQGGSQTFSTIITAMDAAYVESQAIGADLTHVEYYPLIAQGSFRQSGPDFGTERPY